jgi:hypothetical protein
MQRAQSVGTRDRLTDEEYHQRLWHHRRAFS